MNKIKEFENFFKSNKNKRVYICGHKHPDHDSTSSQFALQHLLKKLGILDVRCIKQADYPKSMYPMLKNLPTENISDINNENAVLVCVDCASIKRIDDPIENKFPKPALQIDHHASNSCFASNNFVNEDATATAEIISEIFIHYKIRPSQSVANLLYAGIISDSHAFSIESTTAKTFDIAKWLLNCGVKPNEIHNIVFNSESIEKIKLQQALFGSLEFFCENQICIGYISQNDLSRTGAKEFDKDKLVDKLLAIENVKIAAIINEKNNSLKVNIRALSSRSKVNEVAEDFGGGGHFEASAFSTYKITVPSLKRELVARLKDKLY